MVFQFDIVDVGKGKDLQYQTIPRNWTLPDFRERVRRTQGLSDGSQTAGAPVF